MRLPMGTPMFVKSTAARLLPVLLAAAAVAVIGVSNADAAPKKKRVYGNSDQIRYGSRGPNVVYQAGPRTRVYVTKRSWLDAGTEVQPGERHFSDYAFPPGYSFARENGQRPLDRWPLNPASDLGGSPTGFPLY
ncbi:hypothetical protein [Rhodopseudomonas palustris]|uniref:Uncharacterized protein n=1 Tax=Rhodopseudomonas palustris (strain ATCC BAA-98 / CGA009) TaxID=258594 RepID=Q6ND81_RHOPA|nr:hypothetical protein [Rhodopseudomonas palustris]OPF93116.1 hypothetical protein B1S06_11990 [Rhodopseudomonas palustris]PPQ42565.1 hypothetical protein CKO39_15435 [Rhodopseudomonas palustris]QQM01720.1 hypothetical protein I8G32_00236 [Rhodopseudomonas palustris]RJF64528.1 hypothetical protein D4Q71_10290 [Rhodopseudomonas palustris]WAB77945.1 hypothetical protein OR798_01180 [Rhodopseudomonas palustris]